MEKIKKSLLLILTLILITVSVCGCSKKQNISSEETNTENATEAIKSSAFDNSPYKENTTLGEGSKFFLFTVKVGEEELNFTIKTDVKYVGIALLNLGLIEGEQGDYGLYVKKVNGITADYDTDASYWCFYVDGEMAMSGVDSTEVADGGSYLMEYTK